MHNFFTLIYIRTNRFSDEKFCVGLLSNLDGVPYFGYSLTKLTTALSFINSDLSKSIKRSFNLLESDANKIIKGEEPLSLFDAPYSKKILDKLTLKKRGVVQYSDLYESNTSIEFSKLYRKFIGEDWTLKTKVPKKDELSFKKRFHHFVNGNKYKSYTKKYKMTSENYPSIYVPLTVDFVKKDSYYIVFQTIDFSASITTIQNALNKFRLITQSLGQKSDSEGLGKGRYYLVYESQSDEKKRNLIKEIKESSIGFELLRMSEMGDKK